MPTSNHSKQILIGHVRYIKILTWLWVFQDKLLYLMVFSLYSSLFWELRELFDIFSSLIFSLVWIFVVSLLRAMNLGCASYITMILWRWWWRWQTTTMIITVKFFLICLYHSSLYMYMHVWKKIHPSKPVVALQNTSHLGAVMYVFARHFVHEISRN